MAASIIDGKKIAADIKSEVQEAAARGDGDRDAGHRLQAARAGKPGRRRQPVVDRQEQPLLLG